MIRIIGFVEDEEFCSTAEPTIPEALIAAGEFYKAALRSFADDGTSRHVTLYLGKVRGYPRSAPRPDTPGAGDADELAITGIILRALEAIGHPATGSVEFCTNVHEGQYLRVTTPAGRRYDVKVSEVTGTA